MFEPDDAEALFAGLLPADVALAWECPLGDEAELFPEEIAEMTPMVPLRRREFAAGRRCARRALARLGMPPVAVPRSAQRAPRWPSGVVGSITHGADVAAAAVAPAAIAGGVGLDVERIDRFDDAIGRRICTDAERSALAPLSASERRERLARTFSAKECVHKVWAPRTGITLPFAAVEVRADGPGFALTFLDPALASAAPAWRWEGSWSVRHGLVAAALVLRPR